MQKIDQRFIILMILLWLGVQANVQAQVSYGFSASINRSTLLDKEADYDYGFLDRKKARTGFSVSGFFMTLFMRNLG